jgi:aspartate racemase
VKRIGLIGGMSWESTRSYYSLFNQLTSERMGPWHQPRLLVDSIDFSEIVALQNVGDWKGAGAVLADSARRLQAGGATVLGIGANTMHKSFDDVARAVTIPVLDIRDAIVEQLARMNVGTFSLLGTKYLMEGDFYSAHLERRGVKVVKPDDDEIQELQHMIYAELTQGVVSESSRAAVRVAVKWSDCAVRSSGFTSTTATPSGPLSIQLEPTSRHCSTFSFSGVTASLGGAQQVKIFLHVAEVMLAFVHGLRAGPKDRHLSRRHRTVGKLALLEVRGQRLERLGEEMREHG